MFDPLLERNKLDRRLSQVTASSLRLAGFLVLAILVVAGLCVSVLVLQE